MSFHVAAPWIELGMEMNDVQSLQHVALNNFTKSINDKNINVFISLCFGHSRLIMTVHESSGFPWFRGRCQSFGGPCLSFHNGVNFVCSATLFLSLVCKASCNTDTRHKSLISFSRHFGSVYMYSLRHSDTRDSVSEQCDLWQPNLGSSTSVFLPLYAVIVVLFPLLAGWGGTESVIIVKTIPKAFTMSEFTPVVITYPGCLRTEKAGIITKPACTNYILTPYCCVCREELHNFKFTDNT